MRVRPCRRASWRWSPRCQHALVQLRRGSSASFRRGGRPVPRTRTDTWLCCPVGSQRFGRAFAVSVHLWVALVPSFYRTPTFCRLRTAVDCLFVEHGRKRGCTSPFPPPPFPPFPSFPFSLGRSGTSTASRRFWAELGRPSASGILIFGEPNQEEERFNRRE